MTSIFDPGSPPHVSVLAEELMTALALKAGDIAVDCTVGAGGHTAMMLEAVGDSGRVIGIDRDPTALAMAARRLAKPLAEGRLTLVQARFGALAETARAQGIAGKVAGIAADIGVSSMHLDQGDRGFSIANDGPLDMRMDQSCGTSAADLVAQGSPERLERIFREFGEEPKARQIVRAILAARAIAPITTTSQLAALVATAARWPGPSKRHPATRVFQALRIAVNEELDELDALLGQGLDVLAPGGRLAIISFHSLEDRRVKDAFSAWSGRTTDGGLPRGLPATAAEVEAAYPRRGEIIRPFPATAGASELSRNPRARSARLRAIRKPPPSPART